MAKATPPAPPPFLLPGPAPQVHLEKQRGQVGGGRRWPGPWDIWGQWWTGRYLPPGFLGTARPARPAPQFCWVGGGKCWLAAFRVWSPPFDCAPTPPPGPKSPAGSAQESWMLWLGVGGLAEGLRDLKGPVSGPLSVSMQTAPWAEGLACEPAASPSVCSPEPELEPQAAWPSWAASSCPSVCLSWLGSLGAVPPPPEIPLLDTDPPQRLPPTPPAWLPGTQGPWRFLHHIELPGWFFPFFFFWAMQGGGAERRADNGARAS